MTLQKQIKENMMKTNKDKTKLWELITAKKWHQMPRKGKIRN